MTKPKKDERPLMINLLERGKVQPSSAVLNARLGPGDFKISTEPCYRLYDQNATENMSSPTFVRPDSVALVLDFVDYFDFDGILRGAAALSVDLDTFAHKYYLRETPEQIAETALVRMDGVGMLTWLWLIGEYPPSDSVKKKISRARISKPAGDNAGVAVYSYAKLRNIFEKVPGAANGLSENQAAERELLLRDFRRLEMKAGMVLTLFFGRTGDESICRTYDEMVAGIAGGTLRKAMLAKIVPPNQKEVEKIQAARSDGYQKGKPTKARNPSKVIDTLFDQYTTVGLPNNDSVAQIRFNGYPDGGLLLHPKNGRVNKDTIATIINHLEQTAPESEIVTPHPFRLP